MVPLRRRRERLEIWLGILVLFTAGLLIWGYFWLTGQPLGEPGYTVVTQLPDAEGLERGDRVRISGVEVGSVRDVELLGPEAVMVTLHVQERIRLPEDSRVLLQSAGFFGDRYIELRPGDAAALVEAGDTLVGDRPTVSLIESAGAISDQAAAVLDQMQALLSDTAVAQVHASVGSLRQTMEELEALVTQQSDDFVQMSESLSRTARTLEASVEGGELERTISDVEATAGRLREVAETLRESAGSLASISEKVDRGDGTLGLLVNDPSLYEELRTTVRSVGALTRDIRENPGRYLRLAIF